MELKEGMYVRTKEGIIGKYIIRKEFTNVPTLSGSYETKEVEREYIDDKLYRNYQCIKASYDIIELIEVGDYVNGRKVLSIHCDDGFELYLVLDGGGSCDGMPLNQDIKSIVTKEQFESMQYEIN